MSIFIKYPAIRKLKTRIKRWHLGRQYRHMAKISHNLKIDSKNHAISWKNKHLCAVIPFNKIHDYLLGKTAFIIASGPSIKNLDASILRDKYTFGVNGSILKFIESGITPSFYVISDEDFIYNRPQLLSLILQNRNCHCFFTPQAINAICELNPNLLEGHPKISLFHNHFKEYGKTALEYSDIAQMAQDDPEIITQDGRIGFSLNPDKGVFTAHTVPYFALQIAYGLGFRIVNLIGLDLGSQNGATRFYEQGASAMPSHLDRDYSDYILPSFEIVGELCRNKTFQVFNLSPSSRLPNAIIPKKSFDDAVHEAGLVG